MVLGPPGSLPAGISQLRHQAMDIGGFTVEQIPNHSLPDHVEEHELVAPVIDVFHHHAVFLRCLTGIHDLPELFQGNGHGHFHKGVRSVPHAIACDAGMRTPIRADDDRIRLQLAEHGEILHFTAGISRRLFPRFFPYPVHSAFRQIPLQVAHAGNLHAVHHAHLSQVGETAATHADESYPDPVQSGSPEPAHVHGTGGAGRRRSTSAPKTLFRGNIQGLYRETVPDRSRSGGQPQGFEKFSAR